jgi:Mn2+/Fe2+ NRAMP family transporter
MLYIGVGIIGATAMPHNLYLHSALVQTWHINAGRVVNNLLVLSQVVLSLQLPFAMLPLIFFVTRLKAFRPPLWLRSAGWMVTALILLFNAALLWSMV